MVTPAASLRATGRIGSRRLTASPRSRLQGAPLLERELESLVLDRTARAQTVHRVAGLSVRAGPLAHGLLREGRPSRRTTRAPGEMISDRVAQAEFGRRRMVGIVPCCAVS